MAERGLTRRLGRDLIWQAVYISFAVFIGIFAVSALVEDVLLEQALEGEAEYYWLRESEHPGGSLPDTQNMTGYREGTGEGVPPELRDLEPGYHRMDEPRKTLTMVSERDGEKLFLVFELEQVNELVTLFGLVPLALALSVIYLSLYSAYRVSRRAVSPIVQLAGKIQAQDPRAPDASGFDPQQFSDAGDEILVLSEALQDLISRTEEFATREQTFTRDASHELRTPLTIIRMATDRLAMEEGLSKESRTALTRIKKSANDMERLTAAFLLLARESKEDLEQEWVSVNTIATDELDRMGVVFAEASIQSELVEENQLLVLAPEKVVESVIANLIRNAFSYTDEGTVTVQISGKQITIIDTGPGMDKESLDKAFEPFYSRQQQRGGFGVGLTIVKRMTERFDWPIEFESELGTGTKATIVFPKGRELPGAQIT